VSALLVGVAGNAAAMTVKFLGDGETFLLGVGDGAVYLYSGWTLS